MAGLFRLCAKCPLWLLQSLGAAMGWLVYVVSRSYRAQFKANTLQAGYSPIQVRGAIAHAGRMSAELPRLWLGIPPRVTWSGLEYLQTSKQATIFLTAHIGGFEMGAQALGAHFALQGKALQVLYRPSRQAWLEPLVRDARSNHRLQTVPATLAGVKTLVKALRAGQPLAMAADQVPPEGMGVWAPWLGKSAYTMTLATRLAQQTQAQVFLFLCERLPRGQGFHMQITPCTAEFSSDAAQAAAQMNQELETLVRMKPEQYLWGYARYKTPRREKAATP